MNAVRPLSLRTAVESDLALDDAVLLEIIRDVRMYPPSVRAENAERWSGMVDRVLAGDWTDEPPIGDKPRKGDRQDLVNMAAWRAELMADPDLAEQVARSLPEQVRAEFETDFKKWRRPHPIEVKVPETWWACANCGTVYEQFGAEAVVITGQPGHSELDYDITYCGPCVGIAHDAVRKEP